jgi:GNAT superfamily N-acetyltransferase
VDIVKASAPRSASRLGGPDRCLRRVAHRTLAQYARSKLCARRPPTMRPGSPSRWLGHFTKIRSCGGSCQTSYGDCANWTAHSIPSSSRGSASPTTRPTPPKASQEGRSGCHRASGNSVAGQPAAGTLLRRVLGSQPAPGASHAQLPRLQAPHDLHYYLFILGVEPGWQGKGIGTSLMRPILERCDRERIPAYLEASAPRNRDLYLRNGFEVVEEIQLSAGGPPLWRMWREPRA